MPHTILVLLFGDLGDTLLTVPALRAVRRHYPASRLLVMAKPLPGRYVCDLGLADELIDVNKHALDRFRSLANPLMLGRLLLFAGRLRRRRIDQLIVFQHLTTYWGSLKYAFLGLATGAPLRAGLDNGRGWFLTHRVRDRGFGAVHESQYWLEVAGLVGAQGDALLEATWTESDVQDADQLLGWTQNGSQRIVAIHPGVGWYGPGRQWGGARFADVIAELTRRPSIRCVLVGSELDRAVADAVVARLDDEVLDLVGRTTVGQLAAVLRRCAVLVSNDGGVAHLAAAVGTRTLTVFGPSNDAAWRPLGGDIITADLPCRPCFYRDFEIGLRHGCATRECLAQIEPADVAARVTMMLEDVPVGV